METPTPINDERLTADMHRLRNGPMQLFRRDCGDNKFISSDNADVVLQPPERHLFADLIDGEWHWVNGCAECNGQERDWMTYIECDRHNVCRTCKTPRSQLTETPWGGKRGWQCKPCADIEHEAEKAAALTEMPDEYDELDYWHESTPRCPYCNFELRIEGEDISGMLDSEQKQECPRCDNAFTIEAECSISYTTRRKAEPAA